MISDIFNSILTLHLGINTMVSISIGLIILPEIMYKMLTSEIFVWIDGWLLGIQKNVRKKLLFSSSDKGKTNNIFVLFIASGILI